MNHWTPLSPLPPYEWLTKPLLSRQKKLNARIDEVLTERTGCDADRDAMATAPLTEIDPQTVQPAAAQAAKSIGRFGLLQRELVLRGEIAEYLADADKARMSARSEAEAAHDAVKADVRRRLVEIGYSDSELPTDRGFIQPGMIMRHPAVLEARERADGLHSPDGAAQVNGRAIDTITRELEDLRRRAVC